MNDKSDLYSKRINILFCLHYSGINNGAVRSLIDIIDQLVKEEKINAFVVYPDKKSTAIDHLEKENVITKHIPFYRIDFKKNITRKEEFKYLLLKIISPISYKKLLIFSKTHDIDIVYSNTTVIDYGYKISKKLAIPHIWHIREFGKEDHGIEYRGGEKYLYSCMSNSNELIYISKSIENKYKTKIDNNYVNQQVIYNDISNTFINPKNDLDELWNNKIIDIAIIGTIQEGKGQLDAIKAIQIVNKNKDKVILHICGKKEGSYYSKLKQYVEKNNISEYILFDGFHEDMNAYRKKMLIGIVASDHEAFGRVTIEGMLSQMLMIGSASDGTSELIRDGVTGFLYKPHDIDMLASLIDHAISNINESINIARSGYDYAKESYTKGVAAKKIESELYKLIGK